MEKVVIIVIAATGFQPVEYHETRRALEEEGFRVVTASDHRGAAGGAVATDGSVVHVDLLVEDLVPEHAVALVLIGGSGVLDHLDTNLMHTKLKVAVQSGIVIGAICMAPRILAHAGVLKSRKATGWDGDRKLAELYRSYKVRAQLTETVVTDGRMVTGQGPAAAYEFGKAVAHAAGSLKDA